MARRPAAKKTAAKPAKTAAKPPRTAATGSAKTAKPAKAAAQGSTKTVEMLCSWIDESYQAVAPAKLAALARSGE